MKNFSCDIFCKVVDNYGDIGVCWRLARQLANEFDISVRLWVDDLKSLARLCPDVDAALNMQSCRKVEVRLWDAEVFNPLLAYRPPSPARGRGVGGEGGETLSQGVIPADLVIETFSCKLPEPYLSAMAARQTPPVWINLEYLSAEGWVEGCHRLPSPRPPLTRYFFFPGFTQKTGGQILEQDLLARRDAFLKEGFKAFWQSINMGVPSEDTLKISLFAYENAALEGLFDAWAESDRPVLCLVPQGRILPQVVNYFGETDGRYARGNLQVVVLPFVEQEKYDELLWACDINFVRGEDSFVRAQWAGKPLVWQIYPQHDEVHLKKLKAFLALYCNELSPKAAKTMQDLWEAWNGNGEAMVYAWREFASVRTELERRAMVWADELSENNLALNLLDFFQELGTMRAFKIEGQ